eukprot:Skav214804  [mRNA]  locus=scaffold740:180664:182807:- [translate_table: standard]
MPCVKLFCDQAEQVPKVQETILLKQVFLLPCKDPTASEEHLRRWRAYQQAAHGATDVDPALLSSALPPGSTAPELKARIHSLPEALGDDDESHEGCPQELTSYFCSSGWKASLRCWKMCPVLRTDVVLADLLLEVETLKMESCGALEFQHTLPWICLFHLFCYPHECGL